MVCVCPFERMYNGVGIEVLDHSLRDETRGTHNADGQQDVEHAAGQIDPEVAQVLRAAARQPTHSATASAMPAAAETKL